MEASGYHGQTSTTHAQPILATSKSNSAVSWDSAFPSLVLMPVLQTAAMCPAPIQRSNGSSHSTGVSGKHIASGYELLRIARG